MMALTATKQDRRAGKQSEGDKHLSDVYYGSGPHALACTN